MPSERSRRCLLSVFEHVHDGTGFADRSMRPKLYVMSPVVRLSDTVRLATHIARVRGHLVVVYDAPFESHCSLPLARTYAAVQGAQRIPKLSLSE